MKSGKYPPIFFVKMLAMTRSHTFYYLIPLLCLIICPSTLVFGNPYTIGPDDRNSDQVSALILQLDSKDFQQREQAGEELINIGEQAIRPLALKSLECSPEACWRIRKILEQISTRGNEAVFYKTTGILQLRFDSNNAEMEQRLAELETKWKVQRKNQAISTLRKSGAVVNDPLEGKEATPVPQIGRELILGGGRHILIVDGKVVEQSPINLSKPKRSSRKRLSDTEVKREIERILSSDLKQARKIVVGEQPTVAHAQPTTQPQILAGGAFLGGGAVRGSTINIAGRGPGVTIEIGDRWQGNAQDLGALGEVSNLTEVKLTAKNLDDSVLEKIASIKSINKLVFEKCDISAEDLKKFKWSNSIKEIELVNLTLSNELLAGIGSFPSVSLLTFRECELDQGFKLDALKNLQPIRGLQFEGLDLSSDLFESFGEIKQLSYINLSYCKFRPADYKALEQIRPNLQISYTAKALLGVRGPIDMGQVRPGINGCIVSEVIAGSGAQKGGMKVHDVIESVNGHKVKVFEDLRLHIAQHLPGEKLDVTVNRLGKSLDLEIELSGLDKELR